MMALMGTRDEQGRTQNLRVKSAAERRQDILDAVEVAGFVSVTELTQRLGVSDMTVRRDLRRLADRGAVRVVHGGVSSLRPQRHSSEFAGRAEENAEAKRAIGRAAALTLAPGSTVAVDAGTTTYAAIEALPDGFDGTLVTHSIPVMQLALTRGLRRVVGLGGELLVGSQAFVGPRTVEATKGLRVDTLLLGAAAVDDHGIYVSTDNERATKLALMEIAERIVLLVDASKFLAPAPVLLCGWDAVTEVVTEGPPPPAVAERLRSLGSQLHLTA